MLPLHSPPSLHMFMTSPDGLRGTLYVLLAASTPSRYQNDRLASQSMRCVRHVSQEGRLEALSEDCGIALPESSTEGWLVYLFESQPCARSGTPR